jgi:hypothetical protein
MEMIPDPERVSEIVAPLLGCEWMLYDSGGLRYAPTTGYSLTAFQAEKHFRSGAVFLDPGSRTCFSLRER